MRVVQPDGSTRWLVHKGFPIRNSRGEAFRFAGFAEDVTARKILEKEILEISSREQRRIGLDLHDGLGQHLAGILCLSRGLAKTLAGKDLPEAAAAAEIADLIKEAIAHTRALARGACPVELELSLIHISEPTRILSTSYAVFCLENKKIRHTF